MQVVSFQKEMQGVLVCPQLDGTRKCSEFRHAIIIVNARQKPKICIDSIDEIIHNINHVWLSLSLFSA